MSRHRVLEAVAGVFLLFTPAARADWYVANSNSNNVSVSLSFSNCGHFNGAVPVGARPIGVAASRDGSRVYVTNYGAGTVSVINPATVTVAATFTVGGSPLDVAVHPDGSRIYVISNNRVAVVDTGSGATVANIFVVGFANRIAVHPDGTRVYVTTAAGLVVVINTASNAVMTSVPVGTNPVGVAIHPAGTTAYVAASIGLVVTMDLATNTVTGSVPVEGVPEAVAFNPSGSRVYVTNNMNVGGISTPGKLTAIDTATNAILVTQTIDANPFGIAVDRHNIFVTTADGGSQQGFAGHLWLFDTATTGFVHRMDAGSIPAGVATFVAPDPPPLPADVQVTGIEITQAIQDMSNTVRLVSGRRTFVRVHVKATGAPVPGVTARLFAIRDSCTDAFCISSNIGSITPNKPESIAAGSSPHRRNLNDSLLFELPTPWTNEDALRFHALLGTNFASAPDTCRTDAPHASAFFDDPTTLKIQFIRLAYYLGGTYYEATKPEQQQSESWIRRTYPLSNLVVAPDYPMPDYGLTSRVDQSAKECQDMDAADRNQCAQRYITNKLALMRTLGALDVVGDADGAYALIPQAANPTPAMPNPFFTRGACCDLQIGAGPAHIADYAAHEIGHLLGRQHPVPGAGACGHTADDSAYPHPLSLIHAGAPFDAERGLNGFDVGDKGLAISQTPLADFNVYDLMGYCKPDWISDYSYNALYISLLALHRDGARSARKSAAAGAAVAGDWLAVFGAIPGNPARPAYIQARRLDRVATVPERVPGSYSVRLVGAGGALLADYPFTPEELADSASAGAPSLRFGHAVPFVAGTKTIQIVDLSAGGLVRGTKTVSANPPAVSGVVLQSGPDPVTGEATLSWTASDLDGDPLTYDVLLTRDGGASLQILASGIPLTSTTIDTAPLGGGLAQFRVMASDGVQTGFADSAPFTLVNRPPRVRIVTPGDGTTVGAGQVVNLEGSAFDPQGGAIADANLAWTIPGRALGQGSRLTLTDLPIGPNPVTLTATNGLGLTGSVTVNVVVTDGSVPAGPTLTAGPLRLGWHVAAGETQLQSADLDVGNAGSGSLEFTAQSSAPWLTLSAPGGNAPETLTLTANPSGLPAGTTASAEVTLTGVGLPGQTIVIPATLSVGNTFDVGPPDSGAVDHCPDDPDKTEPGLCGCGVADSQAGQSCSTGQPGMCGAGTIVCAGGSSTCTQNLPSSPEACDGLDNDCDGATDDGNPGGGGPCATGLPGICAAGVLACTGGSLACQQTTAPGVEICGNGIDEDCNGADLACPPVDACTTAAVLDAFDRPDGAVGANWRGAAGGLFYRVAGQRLDVQLGGPLYWNAGFGTSQAAFVTLATIAPNATAQGVLLKAQDGRGPDASIAVVYDATALTVRVSTRLGRASTPYGSASVAFADGDRLGACATASGDVRIYKNGVRVDTVTLGAADQAFFNPKGGKVGIWSARARKGFLDDFGGGTVVP